MLMNRFLTISIIFIMSLFLANIASAAYRLESGTFATAGGQGNSTINRVSSTLGQGQTIDVPAGSAMSDAFKLFLGFWYPTNTAPVLDDSQAPMLAEIDQGNFDNAGNSVAEIVVDGSIIDVDGSPVEAIAVISVDASNGSWQYSTDNGVAWIDIGNVSEDNALLLDSANRMRFVPNPDFHDTTSFTFRAWDKSLGTAGGTADTSLSGGMTAFSSNTDAATITVKPVYFTISGIVTYETNPIEGVAIAFSHDAGAETTDVNGQYSHTVPYGTTTTVTPSKTGYIFTPPSQTFTNIISADQIANFVGTLAENEPPTVDSVLITNDTVTATNDYVKNGDKITVTASGKDLPEQSLAAGVDKSGVTADLSGFGGDNEAQPSAFNYDSVTQQWEASWTLTTTNTAPGDGQITVTVNAKDKKGNGPTPNTDTIIADNTKPTISDIVGEKTTDAGGIGEGDFDKTYAKNNDTLTLTATVSDDGSGVAGQESISADLTNLTDIEGKDKAAVSNYAASKASWEIKVQNSEAGSHKISVTAKDLVGHENTVQASSAITIDNLKPNAVSSFKATPAAAGIKLEFSFNGDDYYGIRFSRQGLSEVTDSGYPRYDKAGYPVVNAYESSKECNDDSYYPNGPTEGEAIDITETSTPHTDNPGVRDVYYYQSFVYDQAGNFSDSDTANHYDRDCATNYLLGDFTGNDGGVNNEDLNIFSNAFGTDHNHNSWDNYVLCDVGPTSATQTCGVNNRFGLPATDGKVDFEDLIIFAMNFNYSLPAPLYKPFVFPEDTPLVSLSSERKVIDGGEIFPVELKLNNKLKVKGAHLVLNYNPEYLEVVKVDQGDLGLAFFNADDKGSVVDINAAALGADSPLADETIATVKFRVKGSTPNTTLYLAQIDLRGLRNEKADDKLSGLKQVELSLSVGRPDVTRVFHNYPNPFNPETWIPFQLDRETDVHLKIYDIKGHLVKTVSLGRVPPGYYRGKDRALHWDGRNNSGERVASGIYFYQFQAGACVKIRKMAILK